MTTQMHRIVTVLMVALMVGLVAAGWFLVAQPQLAAAAASGDQLVAMQGQVSASEASLFQLRQKKEQLPELTAELTGLRDSIPSTLASSPLVAGIDQEAKAAGVTVDSIAVTDAVPYAPTAAPGSAPAPAAGSATPAPSATPAATPTPAPSASATGGHVPKTDPSITAANFIPVPVTISIEGGWDQTLAFVKNLQTGSRLYAIGTLGAKADEDHPGLYKTSVTGYVFAIIDPTLPGAGTALAAGAVTTTAKPTKKPAPTASATPIPSGTPTPSGTPSR